MAVNQIDTYTDQSFTSEPPRRRDTAGLGSAIRRHPFIWMTPAILLAVLGIVAGMSKRPTYSATATINVGKADIATQATPGYEQASQQLASAYSRLATSQHVANPAAGALGLSPATAASRLSAVPIPNEPTFTVTATGPSANDSVRLAGAAVSALQSYVRSAATQQGGPTQLLSSYHAAQIKADRLQRRVQALKGQENVPGSGFSSSRLVRLQADAQSAALQAQALGNAYVNLQQNGAAPELDILNDPSAPTSTNRASLVERYGVIGFVAGLIIGIALTALLARVQAPRPRRF